MYETTAYALAASGLAGGPAAVCVLDSGRASTE